jgi:hypothetical protein
MSENQLIPIEHKNQRVLTTEQIANAYETDKNVIGMNFNRNKERYVLGKHYYVLRGDELREFLPTSNCGVQNPNMIRILYLWTEKGALLHAKS